MNSQTYLSISIPGISNMTAWFSVNAYDQLDIDLPFQEAQDILLSGNISRYIMIIIITLIYQNRMLLLTRILQYPIPKSDVR